MRATQFWQVPSSGQSNWTETRLLHCVKNLCLIIEQWGPLWCEEGPHPASYHYSSGCRKGRWRGCLLLGRVELQRVSLSLRVVSILELLWTVSEKASREPRDLNARQVYHHLPNLPLDHNLNPRNQGLNRPVPLSIFLPILWNFLKMAWVYLSQIYSCYSQQHYRHFLALKSLQLQTIIDEATMVPKFLANPGLLAVKIH